MIGSVLFTCIFSICVCLLYYMRQIKANCEDFAFVISKQAAGYIDGEQVKNYLAQGEANSQYKKTE